MSRRRLEKEDEEVTHWHSTPLAFAMLPAIGGLFFKNGSAFMTDALLLIIAAVFMNWSIRLPWDWYYSAQSQRKNIEPDGDELFDDEVDETAIESVSSAGGSPQTVPLDSVPEDEPLPRQLQRREAAAAELRRLELLALCATFVFPVMTAYLLHVIRGQLSPSSTGLVSDYNLAIFLLAAEIRPFRQLIRLITSRTLHLRRIVNDTTTPANPNLAEKAILTDLRSRLLDLEARLSDHTLLPSNLSVAQKADISDLSSELRKRYEPRLEGLERAVRRYEKRSATLAMVTEQRLGSLDARLQDAVSLAAVAAQQSQTRGPFANLLDGVTVVTLWPLKLCWSVLVAPVRVVEELYGRLRGLVLGPRPTDGSHKGGSKVRIIKDDRSKEPPLIRKAVR